MFRGALALTLLGTPAPAPVQDPPSPVITVHDRVRHQEIDGFGISQAFRRNELVRALAPERQREILDLWFDRESGAGLSILRLGIGSSPAGSPYDHMVSIQPEDPGGPDAPPRYVWDGDDNSQVWVAKEARAYGVERFYADAWSAPGYMKDNGDDKNGGTLKPEWYQAYARYLVQYTRFYAREGIRITDLVSPTSPTTPPRTRPCGSPRGRPPTSPRCSGRSPGACGSPAATRSAGGRPGRTRRRSRLTRRRAAG